MSYYFVIANPMTGRVVRRTNVGKLAAETNLMEFRVSRTEWRRHTVGEAVNIAALPLDQCARWAAARNMAKEFITLASALANPKPHLPPPTALKPE